MKNSFKTHDGKQISEISDSDLQVAKNHNPVCSFVVGIEGVIGENADLDD